MRKPHAVLLFLVQVSALTTATTAVAVEAGDANGTWRANQESPARVPEGIDVAQLTVEKLALAKRTLVLVEKHAERPQLAAELFASFAAVLGPL